VREMPRRLGAPTDTAELPQAFGAEKAPVTESNWQQRAEHVLEYVRRPDRSPVTDYETIRRFLEEHWRLPIVETQHAIAPMGPLAEADRDYGRCSVRLLDFLGVARAYVVVRRGDDASPRRLLWALLHELGHFLNHYELLLSVGTLYQRLCMNPSLEMDVGRFVQRAASTLHTQAEIDADLFAVDWLLPRWIDDEDRVRNEAAPNGLTGDGYRFYRLRDALDDQPARPLQRDSFDRLNRYGSEERRRSAGPFPSGGSRWKRASWALFNRTRLHRAEEVTTLLDEYHGLAGNPRFVPELTRRARSTPFDRHFAWIRRVARPDVAREVDSVQWAPLLVPGSATQYPEYYIPVRPVAGRGPRDSTLGWRHMMSPAITAPLELKSWLDRGRAQRAGVLLFPRNPAERTLDAEGLRRV
jgi:hypothetical protein